MSRDHCPVTYSLLASSEATRYVSTVCCWFPVVCMCLCPVDDFANPAFEIALMGFVVCSQVLGASSLLFVGTYPLMKRFTHLPQVLLPPLYPSPPSSYLLSYLLFKGYSGACCSILRRDVLHAMPRFIRQLWLVFSHYKFAPT